MPINIATYNPRQTPIHAVDARVKIVLVFAFSITLFCVHTWWGIGLLALLAAGALSLAHIDVRRAFRMLWPLGFILAITLVANSFVFDVRSYDPNILPGAVSAGFLASYAPIPLLGAFGFAPAGFARGCYYIVRIVLLVLASLVLTTTTSSTEITYALKSFLRPFERLGLPTHDVATVVSIALRFIPVSIDEFQLLRDAQTSRGATFNTGGLAARLKAWTTVLVPLFVGLYRRADNLALAMDARCYGGGDATQLAAHRVTKKQASLLAVGLAVCACVAVLG